MAALALWLAGRRSEGKAWLAIAAAYLLGVFVLTREINIPINNALALWNPQSPPAAWQQARDDWNLANLIRCLAACASFAAALCTLVYRRQNMVS